MEKGVRSVAAMLLIPRLDAIITQKPELESYGGWNHCSCGLGDSEAKGTAAVRGTTQSSSSSSDATSPAPIALEDECTRMLLVAPMSVREGVRARLLRWQSEGRDQAKCAAG